METKNSISIKRSIAIKAVVTPTWKEDAEKELSKAISNIDQQLSQLEQEGQQIVNNIRSQSVNPLDPRVQEQVSQVQQQVASKRNEIEEQIRNQDIYKIGITENLLNRMSQLNPDEIIDVIKCRNFRDLERNLHREFKEFRIPQTEYFRLSNKQLRSVSEKFKKWAK